MSIIEDKIKKLTPKQQTLLLFFMPALIIGAFMYFVYLPGSTAISDLETTVQQNESEISKSQIMQRKLKVLEGRKRATPAGPEGGHGELPSPAEGDGIPDSISGAAKESGLSVKSVNAGDKIPGPNGLYTRLP